VWGICLASVFVPFTSQIDQIQKNFPLHARLYGDSVSLITILFATWLLVRFLDRRPFVSIGFAGGHILKDILIGLSVGSIWLVVSLGIALSFGWASPTQPTGFNWLVLIEAAISMLLNVITQELLLCGFILQTIRSRSNVITAVIISALLFAGYHAGAFKGEWLPAVNVFAAGLIFCLAYIKTGNLWLPISIHFAWDVLLGPVLGLTESGRNDLGAGWKMFVVNGPPLFTGGKFGLEGGLIVTITALSIILISYRFQNHKISESFQNSEHQTGKTV
jgi:uncharacterized protein